MTIFAADRTWTATVVTPYSTVYRSDKGDILKVTKPETFEAVLAKAEKFRRLV